MSLEGACRLLWTLRARIRALNDSNVSVANRIEGPKRRMCSGRCKIIWNFGLLNQRGVHRAVQLRKCVIARSIFAYWAELRVRQSCSKEYIQYDLQHRRSQAAKSMESAPIMRAMRQNKTAALARRARTGRPGLSPGNLALSMIPHIGPASLQLRGEYLNRKH